MRAKSRRRKVYGTCFNIRGAAFLYTFRKRFFTYFRSFIIRPGSTSLDFLKGKRKQYQPPVSYLFICAGMYILVHNFIINHYDFHVSAAGIAQMELKDQANILLQRILLIFNKIFYVATIYYLRTCF